MGLPSHPLRLTLEPTSNARAVPTLALAPKSSYTILESPGTKQRL